ncbi:MAG: MFS transporter [Pseudomonadota bacterium]
MFRLRASHPFRPAAPGATFQDFCPQSRRRFVLICAILASAMGFIDGTAVSIALPAILESLDAGLADAQWINNSYMLVLSALILVGGAAGDRFGLHRVFGLGIWVFGIASLACALAPSSEALIAARALQGLGAAMMVPGSLALIAKTYPEDERDRAIGIWAAASAVTTAAGPVLGGLLLSVGGPEAWRLIFAINLPVAALVLALLYWRVPPDRPVSDAPPDLLGAGLATLGLGLLAWALTGPEGEGGLPPVGHILGFGLAGVVVFAAFLAVEARSAHPMMPLRLFRSRSFSSANLLTFCLYFALSAVLFYLPMTLIAGWGLPPQEVGLVFLPLTFAVAIASGPVGALSHRIGPGPLVGGGSLIVGIAYGILAFGIGWQDFWAHVMPSMALMAIGMALVVAPLSAAVMGAVSPSDSGAASGINNAVSRVAGLVAVASMGGVAAMAYSIAGGTFAFGVPLPPGTDPETHDEASNAAFAAVAWITALLCLVAAAAGFLGLSDTPGQGPSKEHSDPTRAS